jgi:hypothetical protein
VRSLAGFSLVFYQPAPERAATLPRGGWRLSTNLNYAAIEDEGQNAAARVELDGEILAWELRADYGVTDRFEVSLTLPVYYTTGGFMDGMIEDFHDLTGWGRSSSEEKDRWLHEIAIGGETVFDPDEDEFGLADVPIQVKYAILSEDEHPLALATRIGIELPTGSESRDLGNGGIDAGLGLLAEKSFEPVSLFASFDAMLYDRPSDLRSADVSLEDFGWVASFGGEWRPGRAWAIHAQFDAIANYVRGTSLSKLDDAQLIPSLGVSAALGERLRLRFAISEDLGHAATADVAFYLGLSWQVP